MEERHHTSSEIYYFDDKNNLVDKDHYTHGIIREVDENGNRVQEVYFIKDPELQGKTAVPGGEQKNGRGKGAKLFAKLCLFDLLPAILAGSFLSVTFIEIYSKAGYYDALLFGGVCGLVSALTVNAVITAVKMRKRKRKNETEA